MRCSSLKSALLIFLAIIGFLHIVEVCMIISTHVSIRSPLVFVDNEILSPSSSTVTVRQKNDETAEKEKESRDATENLETNKQSTIKNDNSYTTSINQQEKTRVKAVPSSSPSPCSNFSINDMLDTDSVIVHHKKRDDSAIVVPEYRLIFFFVPKVGCTIWKELFRRIAGFANWQDHRWAHAPQSNGLKYLPEYTKEEIHTMLCSKNWTKAIIVRDPKERLLSAYLDKAFKRVYIAPCCAYKLGYHPKEYKNSEKQTADVNRCLDDAQSSVLDFFNLVKGDCYADSHWKPQSKFLEPKYWKLLEDQLYVGHMESIAQDSRILLKRLGIWETYGASGWGVNGSDSMFPENLGNTILPHVTNAAAKLLLYYNETSERIIDEYYAGDYELKVLNLTHKKIQFPNK